MCPEAAISVPDIDDGMSELSTINLDNRWLGYGDCDISQLVRVMASRRSCRSFLEKPVEHSLLEDLVKIGAMAPSATNRQSWTFTILPARSSIIPLVNPVCMFYERLNELVSKAWFRLAMTVLRRDAIDFYYRAYLPYLEEKIEFWRNRGQDKFFYEVPAAIMVGSSRDGILVKEDALLATQNMLLAAHGMGLGTCLLGLVAGAMQRKPEIARKAGIPAGESLHTVIAVGYSDQIYRKPAGRKKAEIRIAQP
jgi:nitroreductase